MTTFERVKGIIVETLGCAEEEVTLEANLFDDLGADSIDAIEIGVLIEEEFGIEISNEQAERLKTINSVIQYVKSHQ
ncbi:MAG: acyl carrier protein [Sporomusaceae bacterium]|nr:acyl carrier protein [Sporomusaceae bacterium]